MMINQFKDLHEEKWREWYHKEQRRLLQAAAARWRRPFLELEIT